MSIKISPIQIVIVLSLVILVACTPGIDETTLTKPSESRIPNSSVSPIMLETVSISPDQVTVSVSQGEYYKGETLIVSIANGLDQNIYTNDMKTGCTIAILEKQEGSDWYPFIGCGAERPPMTVEIAGGEVHTVSIDPGSGIYGLGKPPGELAFGAGTYRIKFTYSFDPNKEGEETFSVYSEEISIIPK